MAEIKLEFSSPKVIDLTIEFSSPKVIDLTIEKSRDNSQVFLLNLNNSLNLYKIN
jgi:hypothetical protein